MSSSSFRKEHQLNHPATHASKQGKWSLGVIKSEH